MADFIAVIRRAVDGLSENTPEMRVKVYDRARSAVVRQLENMKPRPPESMFQRQLDKLDAAIREVEADYAEALPPEPVEEAAPQPEPERFIEAEPEHGPEPIAAAPEPAVEPQPEPAPEAAPEQDVYEPVVEEQPAAVSAEPETVYAEEQAEPAVVETVEQAEPVSPEPIEARVEEAQPEAVDEYPAEQPFTAETVDHPASADAFIAPTEPYYPEQPAEAEQSFVAEQPEQSLPVQEEPAEAAPAESISETEVDWRDQILASEPVAPASTPEPAPLVEAEPIEPDAEPFTWPQYEEPAQTVAAREPEPVQAEWPQTPFEDVQPAPVQPAAATETAAFGDSQNWAIEPQTREPEGRREPEMPRVVYDETDVVSGFNAFVQEEISRQVVPPPPGKRPPEEDLGWGAGFDDLPDLPKTDAFDDALKAKQDELATAPQSEASDKDKSPRAELAELVGFDEMAALTSPDPEWVQVPPVAGKKGKKAAGKGFKPGKARERGGKSGRKLLPLVAALAGVVVLGGAAYGAWTYRDDLGKMIASVTGPSETPTAPQTEKAVTPSKASEKSAEAPATAKPTEVASLDTGPQKFTQRLMPDGSETESDASKAIVDEALPEGKSVAGQTEKSKEVASTDPAAQTADAKPAAPAGLGVTQKMFLYEERLGQTTPSATPGSVAWSETTEDDGDKPVPSIQAKVEAPGRKLTALITFKKNMDPSLPASHIVEIVFDLPAGFEEGNVESVQRIAFKQTEQDAGNPLIAVPAKVTDDYHMVALNSDAEAQKVNLDLMKNRGWIDIPITYRNGRRGLITLEKGASGTALFDKVIGEWSALGNQASTPQ
ncbi:hypothetical protein [Rhizobium sp. FKL33]|uniref:hypothetical protein n=1 Tax=Rhizobium sp. FKL33 TaxID=2562307 RepID=UPI0010C0B1EC|nr:hypothetical protein [Rhizobium sp. FKL33]